MTFVVSYLGALGLTVNSQRCGFDPPQLLLDDENGLNPLGLGWFSQEEDGGLHRCLRSLGGFGGQG